MGTHGRDVGCLKVTGDDHVVLVEGVRTPIGRFGGTLREVEAHELAAVCIVELLKRSSVGPDEIDEVIMGQVGQVGPDAYNARRCALGAGLPVSTTAMNVNRLCSSGLQAIITGAQQILLGEASVVVAGGNESMSRQPFLDYRGRDGWWLGNREVEDGTLSLLTDPFGGYPMGVTAERVAEKFGISRAEQDGFAARSQRLAAKALAEGHFAQQIVPVSIPGADAPVVIDEHPRPNVTEEDLKLLRPVFEKDGTVTAGNASGINDGAAAVLLMQESEARRRRLEPRLRLRSWAVSGIEPDLMGYAPALAIPRALAKAGMEVGDLDIVELNEAFAAQAVAVIRDVGLDEERVNPCGGAIALGHPVGATGAILAVKLLYELEHVGGTMGMVTMCIGGGQGMAAVFERP